MSKKDQITVRLPGPTVEKIKNVADTEDVSFSMAIVMIVSRWDEATKGRTRLPVRAPAEKVVEFKHPYPLWLERKPGDRPRSARSRLRTYVETLHLSDEHIIAAERQYMEVWPEAEPPDFDLDNPNP